MIESYEGKEDKSSPVVILDEIREGALESGKKYKSFNIRNEAGLSIGECVIVIDEHSAQVSAIGIQPEYQGRGYGRLAYLELAKLFSDRKFISDSYNSMSDDAKGVWESFAVKGMATKTDTGYEFNMRDEEGES